MWLFKLLQKKKTERIFTKIFRDNQWASDETVSGPGSTLLYTENLRAELPILLQSLGIKKLLDVPCGDFHWLHHTDLAGIEYLGGDIVKELVEANRKKYPERRFEKIDIVNDSLPQADALLSRDCFIHLSNAQVLQAIKNLKKSGTPYLLTNTYPDIIENADTKIGDWRMINFLKAPFCFPNPITVLPDYIDNYPVRHLALWKTADLIV